MKKQDQENIDQESANSENTAPGSTQPTSDFITPINSDTLNVGNKDFIKEDLIMDNPEEGKQPVFNPETTEEKEEEGQSILSFNFIFYILQKYKFPDLISPTY